MAKTKTEYNEYMREYMARRYHRRRAAAVEQLGGKCVVCGSKENLNFDHVDATTKHYTIAKILAGGSTARVQQELRKCQLLCTTCHVRKSAECGDVGLKGTRNGSSKLTEAQVHESRRRWRARCKSNGTAALAKEFGVSRATMNLALKRKTWKHI